MSALQRLLSASLCVTLGSLALGSMVSLSVESLLVMQPYLSGSAWTALANAGGWPIAGRGEHLVTTLPGWLSFGMPLLLGWASWLLGAAWLTRIRRGEFVSMLANWGVRGWRWWLLGGVWSVWWTISLAMGAGSSISLAAGVVPYVLAILLAAWVTEFVRGFVGSEGSPAGKSTGEMSRWPRRLVACAALMYVVTFTAMNWGLWFNLEIPHGDSAMYEEHLWNLEHGKGFRSYLDQGLFLGEHIQVVHLLLIPLHLFWPSHLLLELAESTALALAVIPLFCIAKRHTGSDWGAFGLCTAYLLYFPMQHLDIAIDFKTFRPIAFGVPLLLAMLDQLERGRFRTMAIFALLALSAKEDYAIPISIIGFWLMWFPRSTPGLVEAVESRSQELTKGVSGSSSPTTSDSATTRRIRWVGAAMWLAGAVYLFVAVKFAIPSFHEGKTVHYARYFPQFGTSPGEILLNMLTRPGLLFRELVTVGGTLYATAILVPLGLLPLLSPSRLMVGVPLFVLLCLNNVAMSPPGPFQHFHAPLLPIVLWAAAAGMGRARNYFPEGVSVSPRVRFLIERLPDPATLGVFAATCALLSGTAFSLSPLGTRFWDSGRVVAGRPTEWRSLYLPQERAMEFEKVAPLIPATARVASTDFVHSRFTHCERSYDLSGYERRVANDTTSLPVDTNYVVLDLRHPYTAELLQWPEMQEIVKSLKEQPDVWEEIPDTTNGYFQVFRRRPEKPSK
ncbi:MAG: DUF2079 domain-containing protein [Planctomycetaceae bacterium]